MPPYSSSKLIPGYARFQKLDDDFFAGKSCLFVAVKIAQLEPFVPVNEGEIVINENLIFLGMRFFCPAFELAIASAGNGLGRFDKI